MNSAQQHSALTLASHASWQPSDVLVVDDNPQNLRLLANILSAEGYSIRKSLDGTMALAAVQASPPDLILLDIMMPELDGYEVCRQLKARAATAEIPIIFLSALDEVFDKVNAFRAGAVDYITKPFHIEEVVARVQTQLERQAAKRQVQQLNAELEARVQERTYQLEQAVSELRREAAEHQQAQAKLLNLVLYDSLTGLPNRTYLLDGLAQALERLATPAKSQFALLFLDCDRFKLVNDSLGYTLGDELLQAIAQRLKVAITPEDTLVRLGGDEFAILLAPCEDDSRPVQVAGSIQQLLSTPFCLQRREVFASVSIGIVFGDRSYEQPEHLLRDADTAMHRAKVQQRGSYHIFDPALHAATLQALQLETDLRHALQRRELELYYQPIVDLASGQLFGIESLVRWLHPTRGYIAPGRFIPVAEETGLIVELGEWVLETACQQCSDWQQTGLVGADFTISVNISAHQFAHPQFLDQIDRTLACSGLAPTCLKLEITESAIVDNTQQAAAVLQALRDRHIRLSLDDFGTGYSSLSYLHLFPIDTLKIDRSFIQPLNRSGKNLGLVEAILGIAKALGIVAIAEGIETAEQAQILRQLDCQFGQGYWFAKPLSAAAIADLFHQLPQW